MRAGDDDDDEAVEKKAPTTGVREIEQNCNNKTRSNGCGSRCEFVMRNCSYPGPMDACHIALLVLSRSVHVNTISVTVSRQIMNQRKVQTFSKRKQSLKQTECRGYLRGRGT
jgi:hypothetical protein